jgi:hypothetical protein
MPGSNDVFKSVVTVSVEKALLKIGKFELDSVVYRLKEKISNTYNPKQQENLQAVVPYLFS